MKPFAKLACQPALLPGAMVALVLVNHHCSRRALPTKLI